MCVLKSKAAGTIVEPVDEDSPQLETISSAYNTCTIKHIESLCEDDTIEFDKVIKRLDIIKNSKISDDLNW